jgi:UDP-glucuronate 4-epimerase
MNRILITGAAGFIGFHISHRLLSEGKSVVGIDAMLNNNDLWIKKIRLKILSQFKNFVFVESLINDKSLELLNNSFDLIIHMAAVSGIERFEREQEIAQRLTLEAAEAIANYSKKYNIPVIYASSSSVYGVIRKRKFTEKEKDLKPISSYAISKLRIEEIFNVTNPLSLGLRFFTVYGENGRPDMAYFRFAREMLLDKPLTLYGRGIKRDFTYIEDVVESILLIIKNLKLIRDKEDISIINIGYGKAIRLEKLIYLLAKYLDKKPTIIYKKPRKFDMPYTCSDNSLLKKLTGYTPQTSIESGIRRFAEWIKYILPYDERGTDADLERFLEFIYKK